LKIDNQAGFRIFEKALIPGKSKIRNPRDAGKPGGKEAGRLGSRELGAWRRMGRAGSGLMGFALSITFSCLPGYSRLTKKAIPIG
jgi:hypothetical protein